MLKIALQKIILMKRTCILLFIILSLASCKNYATFTVEGTVPDTAFKDSKVYLVALDGPISKDVDSTVLRDGKFRFEKKADSLCVRILRVPFRLPAMLEDLVVVLDEGKLNVELSGNSYGSGTPLNNKLQSWKDKKHAFDGVQVSIFEKIREAGNDSARVDSLRILSDKLSAAFKNDIRRMMDENLNNGIGLLLFKVYYYDLSAEEKNKILSQIGTLYTDHDAQLKLMIQNDKAINKR
jgi:hypothetical protein